MQVHLVLGLVPYHGLGTFKDVFGDLLAPVCRQAVENYGIVFGQGYQPGIYLVRHEDIFSPLCLALLAHAGPNVCIYDIGVPCRLFGVIYYLDGA